MLTLQEFQGALGPYKLIKTEDGSETFWSGHFNESAHSLSGALSETKKFYLENGQVLHKAQEKSPLFIIEVGFGTGMGLETTAKALLDHRLYTPIHYIAFELDEKLVSYALTNSPFLSRFCWVKLPLGKGESFFYEGCWQNFVVTILLGDARKNLPLLHKELPQLKVQVIYQDPFSPPKNPTLWTVEWFSQLKAISEKGTILTTYSASSSIRKSLRLAGWEISEGGGFGKKRSSTVAHIGGQTPPELDAYLERSPVQALYDKNLSPSTST